MRNPYIYIIVMAITSFFIRVTPLTLIRKPVTNRYLRSFLYYAPYVTLSVMTFPAIVYATKQPIAGLIAMIVGVILAWFNQKLPLVASACCLIVFILEKIL